MADKRPALVVVVLLALCALAGSPAGGAQIETPGLASLRTWLSAIDRHRPDTLDEPLVTIAEWPRIDLEELFVEAVALLEQIKNSGRRPPRRFNDREAEELRELAAREVRKGVNRLAYRAALLHTDLARFFPAAGGVAPVPSSEPGIAPRRSSVVFGDGTPQRTGTGTLHWDFARELLDAVVPDPARDPWVRLWYQATAALFALDHQYSEAQPHFRRARQLFPRDATILVNIGCFYEALAAPRIQDAIQAASLPPGTRFDVAAERPNLLQAADAFREALAIDPRFTEARLRLGRVSGLLGRHEEALRLLRQVQANNPDARTSYYAMLFAGTEEQALGQADEARRSYEKAAALYSAAQSPHLARSLLAWQVGDSRDALRALESTVRPGQMRSQVDDPWWDYFDGLGDNTAALFRKLLDDAERSNP